LSSSTPTVGIGGITKLKAVIKPVPGALKPTGRVTLREGTAISGTANLALVGAGPDSQAGTQLAAGGKPHVHRDVQRLHRLRDQRVAAGDRRRGQERDDNNCQLQHAGAAPWPGRQDQGGRQADSWKRQADRIHHVFRGHHDAKHGASRAGRVGRNGQVRRSGLGAGEPHDHCHLLGLDDLQRQHSSVTVAVTKGASTVTITNNPDAANPGTSTLVAVPKAVSPAKGTPTGLATFVVDSQAPQIVALTATGRAQLNGVQFAVGCSHSVRVTYGGDTLFLTSSGTLTFTS
jgi:hypothetical protein